MDCQGEYSEIHAIRIFHYPVMGNAERMRSRLRPCLCVRGRVWMFMCARMACCAQACWLVSLAPGGAWVGRWGQGVEGTPYIVIYKCLNSFIRKYKKFQMSNSIECFLEDVDTVLPDFHFRLLLDTDFISKILNKSFARSSASILSQSFQQTENEIPDAQAFDILPNLRVVRTLFGNCSWIFWAWFLSYLGVVVTTARSENHEKYGCFKFSHPCIRWVWSRRLALGIPFQHLGFLFGISEPFNSMERRPRA